MLTHQTSHWIVCPDRQAIGRVSFQDSLEWILIDFICLEISLGLLTNAI